MRYLLNFKLIYFFTITDKDINSLYRFYLRRWVKVEINNINPIHGVKKYQQISQTEKDVKISESKKDQITISNEAKVMLDQISDQLRTEKVAKIKAQIESGTYQIDSKLVAEKMLSMNGNNSGE